MREVGMALAMLGLAVAGAAPAHDGQDHEEAPAALPAAVAAALPGAAQGDLPFHLGGPFRLTNQRGLPRTAADPEGRFQLLFFGYANCPSICSVALPTMAAAVELLAERGIAAVPVMITVDPARDTPASMGPPLAAIHPGFVGLTGDEAALAAVQRLFQVGKQGRLHRPRARADIRPWQPYLPARRHGQGPDPDAADPDARAHRRDRR